MTGFRLGTTKKEKPSPPSAIVDEVSAPKSFGIKNYLHQFYLTPTVEDIEQSGAWYLLPPPPAQRRGLFVCRICTLIGLIMLISGAIAIIIAHTTKHERIEQSISKFVLFQDENGGLYVPSDKIELILQDPMRHWKTTGFCLFASGAVLLAVSLITPTLASCFGTQRFAAFISSDNSPNEPPVRVFPHQSPMSSGPVPAVEEISQVQPSEKRTTSTTGLLDSQ